MTLILLSGIITGSLRIILCLLLISRLLSAEKPGKICIAMGLAGAFVISIFLFLTGLSDFYKIILETVWITFCAVCFQKTDRRMSLFISIFYEIAVSFWQFLFMAGTGLLTQSPAFPDADSINGLAALWLLHALLIAPTIYLWKKQDITGKAAFRFASVVFLTGLIAVITLSEQTILAIPSDVLTMWTILAVVLMMSVLVFNMNRQYEVEKELARLKSEQTELLERDYTTLNNAYAVNAKLFHDFHNHIGVLRQLLSHKKYAEAIQYLNELQTPVRGITGTAWTGDETADFLINSKIAAAAANNIQMKVQVEFPQHTNIKSSDLCAVLGNLLDNALEAAGQIPASEHRFIRLTIRRIHQMLVIKVENSFSTAPVREKDGTFQTTKTDGGLHGWGLKSARTAIEKYDGVLQTASTDNVFKAVATLSYQGITTK